MPPAAQGTSLQSCRVGGRRRGPEPIDVDWISDLKTFRELVSCRRPTACRATPEAAVWATCWAAASGGLLGGSAAGSLLSGGLGELIRRFQENGNGTVANSWVGTGSNQAISPQDVERGLGADTIKSFAEQAGATHESIARELTQTMAIVEGDGRDTSKAEAC